MITTRVILGVLKAWLFFRIVVMRNNHEYWWVPQKLQIYFLLTLGNCSAPNCRCRSSTLDETLFRRYLCDIWISTCEYSTIYVFREFCYYYLPSFLGGQPPRPPLARFARALRMILWLPLARFFVMAILSKLTYSRYFVDAFFWQEKISKRNPTTVFWRCKLRERNDPKEVTKSYEGPERSELRGGLGGWPPRKKKPRCDDGINLHLNNIQGVSLLFPRK